MILEALIAGAGRHPCRRQRATNPRGQTADDRGAPEAASERAGAASALDDLVDGGEGVGAVGACLDAGRLGAGDVAGLDRADRVDEMVRCHIFAALVAGGGSAVRLA